MTVSAAGEIDVVPPQVVKREIVRPKCRHRLDRQRPPVLAPAPARVVPGGYASAGLIAWIVISKYVDHLPLYRQEQMSARWGAQLSRRSMCDWVEVAALWLEPIYHHLHRGLIAGNYLQADETPVKCNDPDHDRRGTRQCYLWVISRPGSDVVFAFRESRGHDELPSLLRSFRGILTALIVDVTVTSAACVRAITIMRRQGGIPSDAYSVFMGHRRSRG